MRREDADIMNSAHHLTPYPRYRKLLRRFVSFMVLGVALVLFAGWIDWTETHPEQERELRVLIHEQFAEWFPEQMNPNNGSFGFIPRSTEHLHHKPPRVVLLHGLDEPGDIWQDVLPALDDAGISAWEFRYPNDQAIDWSADYLAEHWPSLETDQPVVLIGHSMGGLVIRDFVSRWRHPVDQVPAIAGPEVRGVILVGTPNHGSGWARLRVWLELREVLTTLQQQDFSLFAGLRDGTGAAKIDLRPDSEFLQELNARPWPETVDMRLIGGVLTEPTPPMQESIEALSTALDSTEVVEALVEWWSDLGEELGDGVVTLESLTLPNAPPPLVLTASHRGLVTSSMLLSETPPPAIAPIIHILDEWLMPPR